jgi:hypothetical protein
MTTTNTYTVGQVCTRALRLCGASPKSQEPEASDMADAIIILDMMLKGWQGFEGLSYVATTLSVTLTAANIYTLDPIRPVRILSCRFKRSSSNEIEMIELTRDEYDELPNKDGAGIPTSFHYDRQREAARLLIWPTLAVVAGETLEITYEREFTDMVQADVIDVPGEWFEAVVYGLASRLIDEYGIQDRPQITARAVLAEAIAFGSERADSVFFQPRVM